MVEVTTKRRGHTGMCTMRWEADGKTAHQPLDPVKPYKPDKIFMDGNGLAQESRPEGTGSLYIYRGPGKAEPGWRGWDKAGKEGPNWILYFQYG